MNNDWFHEYFINELKAIGRKNASKLSYEIVDSLPPSGEENAIYFMKSDSGSSNNHYDEYVWISSSNTFEKIGSTQIDGSTTQPDWNQNDETQPDYIKNRPFYTGAPVEVETVLVEESTVSFVNTGQGYIGQIQSTFVPTIGETYKVTWDGIDYECICIESGGNPALGDINILFGEPDPSGEPFLISSFNSGVLNIIAVDTSASHTFSIVSRESVTPVIKINPKYLPISFKPSGGSYLIFSSANSFTLSVKNLSKTWDGTLEYFTSDNAWVVWDGIKTLVANANEGEYALYLRGTENTVITGHNGGGWYLNGTDVKCIGNIENLLDYATVESGAHPNMSNSCYAYMFDDCTSLTQAPILPATTLATGCYAYMFQGCTSLTQAPNLPATTLATSCYESMFEGCTSLTRAPELPATTLADRCYSCMFQSCPSLAQAPILPVTTLPGYCYYRMFRNCTSLKLSSTKTDKYIQEYRIPSSGNGTTASNALTDMFALTGGTFTGTPEINTTYYLRSDNMIVRETEIATLNGYVGSMINTALSAINVAEEGAY